MFPPPGAKRLFPPRGAKRRWGRWPARAGGGLGGGGPEGRRGFCFLPQERSDVWGRWPGGPEGVSWPPEQEPPPGLAGLPQTPLPPSGDSPQRSLRSLGGETGGETAIWFGGRRSSRRLSTGAAGETMSRRCGDQGSPVVVDHCLGEVGVVLTHHRCLLMFRLSDGEGVDDSGRSRKTRCCSRHGCRVAPGRPSKEKAASAAAQRRRRWTISQIIDFLPEPAPPRSCSLRSPSTSPFFPQVAEAQYGDSWDWLSRHLATKSGQPRKGISPLAIVVTSSHPGSRSMCR